MAAAAAGRCVETCKISGKSSLKGGVLPRLTSLPQADLITWTAARAARRRRQHAAALLRVLAQETASTCGCWRLPAYAGAAYRRATLCGRACFPALPARALLTTVRPLPHFALLGDMKDDEHGARRIA